MLMVAIEKLLNIDRENLLKGKTCVWKMRSLNRSSQGYQLTEDETRCCYCGGCEGCCTPLREYLENHYFR